MAEWGSGEFRLTTFTAGTLRNCAIPVTVKQHKHDIASAFLLMMAGAKGSQDPQDRHCDLPPGMGTGADGKSFPLATSCLLTLSTFVDSTSVVKLNREDELVSTNTPFTPRMVGNIINEHYENAEVTAELLNLLDSISVESECYKAISGQGSLFLLAANRHSEKYIKRSPVGTYMRMDPGFIHRGMPAPKKFRPKKNLEKKAEGKLKPLVQPRWTMFFTMSTIEGRYNDDEQFTRISLWHHVMHYLWDKEATSNDAKHCMLKIAHCIIKDHCEPTHALNWFQHCPDRAMAFLFFHLAGILKTKKQAFKENWFLKLAEHGDGSFSRAMILLRAENDTKFNEQCVLPETTE